MRNLLHKRRRLRLAFGAAALATAFAVSGLLNAAVAAPSTNAMDIPTLGDPEARSLPDLIAAVRPAVVNISTTRRISQARAMDDRHEQPFGPGSPFEEFFRRFGPPGSGGGHGPVQGSGSGFLIDAEGHVVTNNHVVEHAEEITVTLDDGSSYPAVVRGVDPKTDLAVLEIEGDTAFPYVDFGDSDAVRVGDPVVAIGNPFGLGGSATSGIVSARARDIQSGPFDDFIQLDASINPGNSVGPLFDMTGRVIGINTAIYTPNGGNVGIGFAIPAALAVSVIDQLMDDGRVERGWLGVTIQGIDEEIAESLGLEAPNGALVAEVVEGSPAAAAGVRAGDVITAFAGREVEKVKDLTRLAANAEPGAEIEIAVWRDGDTVELDLEVGSSAEQAEAPETGRATVPGKLVLSLAPLSDEHRLRNRIAPGVEGAVVAGVAAGSPAAKKGLRVPRADPGAERPRRGRGSRGWATARR